ncbi:MAG TPA: carbohydrate ABC transporter permease [bacterium]|nr:carbohydrate ABC transporter permease [bacterium]
MTSESATPAYASARARGLGSSRRRARALRRALRRVGLDALMIVVALIVLFPLLFALSTSLKTGAEVDRYPPTLWPHVLNFGNYPAAMQQAPLPRFLLNSFVQAGAITLGQLVTASLAAFAFAFVEFPGRQWLFFLFLSTLMIPGEVTLIPNYLTVRSLGWLDTYPGLIAPYLATAFGTFLLRQFFLTIPRELQDAARIDGASRRRFLWMIVLPLSRPALATLAIYAFLSSWNQYLWPLLVINSTGMRTVQIGLALLQSQEIISWSVVMAGVVLIVLPTVVLFILGYRHVVRGLTAGAVKG